MPKLVPLAFLTTNMLLSNPKRVLVTVYTSTKVSNIIILIKQSMVKIEIYISPLPLHV